MPYNPGIQDQRGQLWAQGLSSAGAGLAQGIQQYAQNKMMASQALGKFEATVDANRDIMQFMQSEQAPPNIVKALQKLGKDGALPLKDAALLSNFADTYIVQKQQALQKQQQALATARAAAISKFMNGEGNSMLTPEYRNRLAAEAATPAGQFAAQAYRYTGAAPTQENMTDYMKSELAARGRPAHPMIDIQKYRSADPQTGKPIEVAVDQLSGKEVGRGPLNEVKYVLSPEEQASAAGMSESAKQEAQLASAFVNSIPDAAEAAQSSLATVNEVERLYSNGAQSGFGQDFINKGTALGLRLGVIKPGQQATQEELDKLMASSALQVGQQLMKGTGQVSNYERDLVNKASAEIGKSPQANLKIVRYTKALAQRSLDLENKRQELVDSGKSVIEIAESLRRWRTKNPLTDYVDKYTNIPEPSVKSPVKDMIYKDANGNRAIWDGTKYVPL